jgi:CRISPR-associated endoribonuclease Cas6
VTSTSPELSTILEEAVIPAQKKRFADGSLLIGGKIPFQVVEMTTDPAAHPWAGRTTYEELYDLHEKGEPADGFEVQFASPTTFHSAGKHLPFPLPELVLGSWLEQWNSASGVSLLEDIRLFGHTSVAISRYNLHTQVVHYDKETLIGFCGQCIYRILSEDDHWRRLVNLLSAFSFYCGTGAKTSFGLGQTRVIGA